MLYSYQFKQSTKLRAQTADRKVDSKKYLLAGMRSWNLAQVRMLYKFNIIMVCVLS